VSGTVNHATRAAGPAPARRQCRVALSYSQFPSAPCATYCSPSWGIWTARIRRRNRRFLNSRAIGSTAAPARPVLRRRPLVGVGRGSTGAA
jgi:hypothetical protein